ncbi:hypothetical protein [uncultured Idiomarina sp.]|uniref:hypothetical protein n=1 Tax=uncultured Idiomarina sp. TaxID=352961 RepID=UPI0025983382|nr:hypothetical protein [uncultured Idiomarina sp.]
MNKLANCCAKAYGLMDKHDIRQLYQFVKSLDEEFQEYRWPELLPCYAQARFENNDKLVEFLAQAVNALKLGKTLALHTHYRRVLAAACLSACINESVDYWRSKQLRQALWLEALKPLSFNSHDIAFYRHWVALISRVQQQRVPPEVEFAPQLNSVFRYKFWQLMKQSAGFCRYFTGQRFKHTKKSRSALLMDYQKGQFLLAFPHKLHTPFYVSAEQLEQWQPTNEPTASDILESLVKHRDFLLEARPSTLQTPKALLTAINRYANASGSLNAVIQQIRKVPYLSESVHQSVIENERINNDEAAKMDIKQAYLWLGAKRASVILATAFLQHQFSLNSIPLHKALMQRINLLCTLLEKLSQSSGIKLPTPAPLLALLSGADLFRHPDLLKSSKWPKVSVIEHFYCSSWVGSALDPADFRRSRQLVARWQLPEKTHLLLDPEQTTDKKLTALFYVAHFLALKVYHPQAQLSDSAQKLLDSCYEALGATPTSAQKVQQIAAFESHCHSPL